MYLKEQEYVSAIAKYGNLKKAADSLYISSPTLSVFLSSLEERMGLKLFDRMGKQFVPTDAGRIYLQNAEEMLAISKRCTDQLSDLKQGARGSIRLGIHPRRTLYLLPKALKKFTDCYPNVRLFTYELSSSEMFARLLAGDLDFVINNRYMISPLLVYQPYYQDHLVAVCAKDHPVLTQLLHSDEKNAGYLPLKPFSDETFILPSTSQSSRVCADAAFVYENITPKSRIIIENLETAAQLAAEGLGISFNFESYIRPFHYSKPVQWFRVGDPQKMVDYWMIYRKDKYIPTYTQYFMECLKEAILEIPYA